MAARPGLRKLMLKSAVSDPVAVPAPLAASLIRGAQDCPALLPLLAETRIEGFPAVDRGDCPTRIVWGTRDRILPPKHLSARFREMLPDAEWVEIPGGGHIPQIDHPERVAELVLELTGPPARRLKARLERAEVQTADWWRRAQAAPGLPGRLPTGADMRPQAPETSGRQKACIASWVSTGRSICGTWPQSSSRWAEERGSARST